MLALRLVRGAHPLVLLRRLLVAATSAGTGFLLLCALGHALAHPGSTGSVLRLAWCALPLAATVYFAVTVARTDPGTKPRPGLASVGLGPGRLMVLSAMTTAVACTLGSAAALLCFLHLRGDLAGLPFDGAAAGALGAGRPLPVAATLTLLVLVPLVASVTTALTLRPRRPKPGAEPPDPDAPPGALGGVPWGIALLAGGLAVEAYASSGATAGTSLPGAGGSPAGVLAGWVLTAVGLALAGPGLTYLCGHLLQTARPGALRLLAGRVLMREARRLGQPLGVVCAVASGTYALSTLHTAGGPADVGPFSTLGALLVAGCAVLTLATAAAEGRRSRTGVQEALTRLGAPASVLRGCAALRTGALLVVFAPLTWLVAELAAMPLTR
ncbi:hypothetical protein GCM10018785_49240 [Streptomyces longispororuber]|uniref:Uncharacterized protein n=1 Tax=Streptomyces longispororuber TaxID=68230 RepID=A0A918ZXD6_9ACTN|nr:hypothetical protein [Streptomyces longispororuber]GHE75059.1 hypothetical protein GCM10018785_49240 [Streptomyces longispororuber]